MLGHGTIAEYPVSDFKLEIFYVDDGAGTAASQPTGVSLLADGVSGCSLASIGNDGVDSRE